MIPVVPYGWQNIGEYLSIDSKKSRRLNVVGILSRKNHLEAYVSTETITSDVIAACIETFFPVVKLPTYIVVDRASIHTSGAIFERLEELVVAASGKSRKERGITIFELPDYSPELNLIEILWRFIKDMLQVEIGADIVSKY